MNIEKLARKIIKGRDLSRDEHLAEAVALLMGLVDDCNSRARLAAERFVSEINAEERLIDEADSLTLEETLALTGLKQNEVYDKMKIDQFPINFKISGVNKYGRKGWLKSEVTEWIKSQAPSRKNMEDIDEFVGKYL